VPGSRLTLRRALPADAETIARTVSLGMDTWRAFAPAGWTPRPHARGVAYARAALSAPSGWAVLAFVDGEPAGHFAMTAGDWDEPHAAELVSLFVRPRWFGSGLADRLHEAFVEAARERGYPWAWLSTPAGNARARRFYERREWRADSLVEVHYGMPWASYGRSLLPPRGGPGHNRPVDAGVGSRP
jgi:GNAT superfamily N-acetyltransferase